MKLFRRQWDSFLRKSAWGKLWDVLFILVIVLLIIPEGRLMVQRTILKTGIMGNTESNVNEAILDDSWDWKLRGPDGEIYTLDELRERPIFLNHWATWCPPCKAEMPSIISLIEQTNGDVNYLLVTQEDPERVRQFLEKEKLDIPVYFPVSPTPEQFRAESLPTTYVINADGKIIHKSEGMRDWSSEEAVGLVLGTGSLELD